MFFASGWRLAKVSLISLFLAAFSWRIFHSWKTKLVEARTTHPIWSPWVHLRGGVAYPRNSQIGGPLGWSKAVVVRVTRITTVRTEGCATFKMAAWFQQDPHSLDEIPNRHIFSFPWDLMVIEYAIHMRFPTWWNRIFLFAGIRVALLTPTAKPWWHFY